MFLALVSIPLWLVFEVYNLFIRNWYYVGLPENFALRMFGYAWSFATIWPAIFEGAELVAVLRAGGGSGGRARVAVLPSVPPALPASPCRRPLRRRRRADAGCRRSSCRRPSRAIWRRRSGSASSFCSIRSTRGLAESRCSSIFAQAGGIGLMNLALSGFLCGVLWEFWNYWSRAKWHYTRADHGEPEDLRDAAARYLGFPAFAIECFTMYVFVRHRVLACDCTRAGARPGRSDRVVISRHGG